MEMADITTDITTLSQSFDTIVSALANYTADDTKQKGANSKALEGIIKSFSLLQTTLNTSENGVTRLDNIKNFFGDSGFVSTLSKISTDKGTLDNFKTNINNIYNTFGGDGETSLGKQLETLSGPLASLKKGIDKLPSFDVGENEEPLAVTFEKRFNSITALANSLNGLEINDIEFKIPDISKLFNSIIETKVETENITKKEWEEITKDEYESLQGGQILLKKLDETETEAEKFFKQVEKLNGTKDVTTYSSKLNAFTTNLLETTKVLNPFKNALSTFVKQDLSLSYKGADIKATEDVYTIDKNGKKEILYNKGDVIASAVPQPITKELIAQKISDINSLIAIANEFQSLNLGANYSDMTKLQVKMYDFIQENVVGTGKDKINTSDGLPLISLLLGDVVKPFNVYRTGLVGFVNGIDSATSDEYDTNEEITKWVSEQGKDGGRTVLKTTKKKGKLSQDIPGLSEKISTFFNLINPETIKSWTSPISKLKAATSAVDGISGKYTDAKNKTRYVVVDNIDSVVNSMSEVMKAIRKLPNKVKDDANDKNIQKKMQSISNVVHAFAKETLVFNTMTELDTLPYLVDSLRLNDKEVVVGGEYEGDDGQVIDEKKYRSLNKEQQKKYTFRAKTKDLSMTHSIQMLCTFMSDIVKSIDKVSNVSVKTLLVAPVKVRMLSKGISKSLTAMISAIDYINQEADFHNIQQVIGWEEGNNQYLINADGSYKMEQYIDGDKKEMRKVENARYTKGHFKAETGLFKIGDYMATMIGIIDKISNFNTFKMIKSGVKINMTIDFIANTIRNIALTIANKMKSLSSGPAAKSLQGLVSSTTEVAKNVIINEKNYNLNDKASASETAKSIIDNSTYKTTNPGVFDIMISFFNVYESMMKIADEKALKLIIRSHKAKFRIKLLVGMLAKIVTSKQFQQMGGADAKKAGENIKSAAETIASLKTLIDTVAKISESAKKASKGIKNINKLLNHITGDSFFTDECFFDLYKRLIDKYNNSGIAKDKNAIKDINSMFTDLTKMTAMVSAVALLGLPALIGCGFLELILLCFVGNKKRGKASILGLMIRMSEMWNNGNSVDKNGGIKTTLLMITGSLLLFVSSLILVGAFVKQAAIGIIATAGLLAATMLILWTVSKFNKGGENNPEKGSIGKQARTLLMISGAFLGFAISLGVLSLFVGRYNAQLWMGLLQVTAFALVGVGILFLMSLFKRKIKKGAKELMFISGAFLGFALTLGVLSLFMTEYKSQLWMGIMQLSLLVLAGVGILFLMSLLKRKINKGAKQLLFIAGAFLAFALVLGVLSLFMGEHSKELWHGVLQVSLLMLVGVGIMFLLSIMKKPIFKGVIMMLLIAGTFLLFSYVLKQMFDAVKDASWENFGMIAATLALMIGAIMGIGAILMVPMAGQIALAMILSGVGVMLAISSGFLLFAETLIKINDVFRSNTPDEVLANVNSIITVINSMSKEIKNIDMIDKEDLKKLSAVSNMSNSISKMAVLMNDLANLRVAMKWDKDGNPIEYRQMNTTDFENAKTNVVILLGAMTDIAKLLSPEGEAGKAMKDMTPRQMRRRAKTLGAVAAIIEPLTELVDFIKMLADGRVTLMVDENGEQKERTVAFTQYFKENKDGIKTTIFDLMGFLKDIGVMISPEGECGKMFADISPRQMRRRAKKLGAVTAIIEPLSTLIDFIKTLAEGKVTLPANSDSEDGKERTIGFAQYFNENKDGIKTTIFDLMGFLKDIGVMISPEGECGKMFADISPRQMRRRTKKLGAVTAIIEPLTTLIDFIKTLAEGQITISVPGEDGGEPKETTISFNEFFNQNRDGIKNTIMSMMGFLTEIAKMINSDEADSVRMSRSDARATEKQANRMAAADALIDPIVGTMEFIKTLAQGTIEYTDASGNPQTVSITKFINDTNNRKGIKNTVINMMKFMNSVCKDINDTDVEMTPIDTWDFNRNANTIKDMMDKISKFSKSVEPDGSYVKVVDSTSKFVSAINQLDKSKANVFKEIIEDLEDMNDMMGDVFSKLERMMGRLVEALTTYNGMTIGGSKKSSNNNNQSSQQSNAMQGNSSNLQNIESDVDDLLNELRSIKALMQR